MSVKSVVRKTTPLFAAILLIALGSGIVQAQAFSSYDSNQLQLLSGFTFSINGVPQTDLSNVGTSGNYVFGFTGTVANPTTIEAVVVSANSIFGPAGTIIEISGINQVGLFAEAGISSSNIPPGSNTIYNYDGSISNSPWDGGVIASSQGGTTQGLGYSVQGFGQGANFLKGLGESPTDGSAKYGSYEFDGISASSQIFFGGHIRVNGPGGNTAPFLLVGIGQGGPVVPEGSSLAMLGMGMLPILGIFIKRKRAKR